MKNTYLTVLLILSLIIYGCNSGTTPGKKDPKDSSQRAEVAKESDTSSGAGNSVGAMQNEFAKKAAIGGMMEVESSTRMIKSTENPDVQTLATIMVRDHGMANKELMMIAKKLKIQLPSVLPKEKTDLLVKMEPLKEDEKNLFYADLMVKEHNEAVALFDQAAKQEEGELKAFAAKHLPILKHHLMEALNVQKMTHSIKGDKGDRPLKISKDRQPPKDKGN
jgi:putative membrane protein